MKNTNKNLGSFATAKLQAISLWLIAAIIGFGIIGCDNGDSITDGKMSLATPTGVDVVATDTSLTLVWDVVEGADSYSLDIGGVLHQVSGFTNSYDLKALTSDPKVYNIRVRAVAYAGDPDHFDSAYSAAKSVEVAEYIFEFEDDDSGLPISPSIRSRSIMPLSGGGKAVAGLKPYGKTLERVVVPSQFGSTPVTAIAPNAFADSGNIMSSISLPNTIITIGAGAFAGTSIGDIVIPESVLNIGEGAFSNCIVLVVVVFVAAEPPAMEANVFQGSDAIETVVVPEGSESAFAEIAEEVNAEVQGVAENDKLLLAIEVIEQPKTAYTVGDFFSTSGMSVIARYSDNTMAVIQNYSVLLRAAGNTGSGNTGSGNTGSGNTGSGGDFVSGSRALTLSDTVVRLSYTEGTVTRTTDIAIKVTQEAEYIININAANGGYIYTNQTGTVKAGTTVTFYVNVNTGFTMTNLRVMNNTTNQEINHQTVQGTGSGTAGGSAGNSYTFVMPASDVTISGTFTQSTTGGGTQYTVTFDASGGTFPAAQPTQTMTYQVQAGQKATPPSANPTRQGYTFSYWYYYEQAAGSTSGGIKRQFNFDTAINSNITLYAEWTTTTGGGTQYTVIFYAEGGTFPSGYAGVSTDGSRLTLQVQAGGVVYPTQAPNPTRQGYTFNYWRQYNQPFDLNAPINSDITLYAEWTTSGGSGTGISYSLAANGSSTQSTTQITINFSGDVQGLTIYDINLYLNGMSETNAGIVKGTLTNDGNDKYFLPISGFTQSGSLSISIQKSGINIIGSPRTVDIFYAGTTGQP